MDMGAVFVTFDFLSSSCRMDETRVGTLVGEDKFGNKYYEVSFALRYRITFRCEA